MLRFDCTRRAANAGSGLAIEHSGASGLGQKAPCQAAFSLSAANGARFDQPARSPRGFEKIRATRTIGVRRASKSAGVEFIDENGGGLGARVAKRQPRRLDWVVRGNHAMFFVAKEKGYFAEENIEVTAIRRGTGSPNAMRLVGNNDAEFGFGDLPTLALARSQDVPVIALAAVNQHSPLAMLALANKFTLKTPQDLKGLNVGVQPAGSTYVFLTALLKANGMTLNDIKQSTVNPPYENYLLLGRVDAVPGYQARSQWCFPFP
jgi:ABC-type nitrate/sulfonate/bicarbonate transport system substrate-binding protein